MGRIIVQLHPDRRRCGRLTLQDDRGRVLCGPFAVTARASDAPAAAHRNPERFALFCYGDTPLGSYRVVRVLPSGLATGYDARQYGPNGVVVLDAVSGDAALAEANGRFHIFIQGGAAGRGGKLRSTNGCMRLFDADLKKLITRIRSMGLIVCECIDDRHIEGKRPVAVDDSYDEGDPPALLEGNPTLGPLMGREYSRRSMIVASAAAVGSIAFVGLWFGREGGVNWVELGPPEAVAEDYGAPPQGAASQQAPASQPSGALQQLENINKNTENAPNAPSPEEQKQQSEFNTQGGASGAPAVNVPPAGAEAPAPSSVQNDATYQSYDSKQKDLQNQAQQVQQQIDAVRAKQESEPQNKAQLQLEESNLKQQRSNLENQQNYYQYEKQQRAKQIIQGAPIIKPGGSGGNQ